MRILAIANRVIKELIRDKRTLALMFVAPIIIILLLSVLFSANSTTNVKIGTVAVSKTIRKLQEQVSHPAGEVAGHVRISIEDWNK
ncbi:hypothetical protein [Pediococcus ethanolidurans]